MQQNNSKPIIVISANIIDENSALHFAYSCAIVQAGGVPVILPANCDADSVESLLFSADGVLLSGGADIDAHYFGEENIPGLTDVNPLRDSYEFMLLHAALNRNIPILGICRGCQVINVALGGTIYQDLPTMYPRERGLLDHSILANRHLPVHDIEIDKESVLYEIVGKESIGVNSRHHQAIKDVAPTLKVTASSEDGVIEAIEGYPTRRIIALQWHPENLATDGGSTEMQRLFAHFISEAALYKRAKDIHCRNIIIDSHCDTPMLYEQGGFNFALRDSSAQVDLKKMQEGYLDTTITVAYIPQSSDKCSAMAMAVETLRRFKADIAKCGDVVSVARSAEDVIRAKHVGAKSILLGVENGLAIESNVDNVDLLKSECVTYITLCHNGSNDICDSAVGDAIHGGVSDFGAAVIRRMNDLGIIVDVSHSSHTSTMDALRISRRPIIASHSSCKALCGHARNLSDEAIVAIAAAGGVIQVCGYQYFLREDGNATVMDVVDHIEYVVKLVGYEHVGVGSDFDGGGGVDGFNGANDFINITMELLTRGHKDDDIAKIMGGNIMRIIVESLS